MQSSSSHSIKAESQNTNSISTERVIYIQKAKRQLANVVHAGVLHHAALILITGDMEIIPRRYHLEGISKFEKKSCEEQNLKFHILEFMDDSQVHSYQIKHKDNKKVSISDEIINFDDGKFIWQREYGNFIAQVNVTINEIKIMMEKVASKSGQYDLRKNNCQTVADRTLTWVREKFIIEPNGLPFKSEGPYP